MANSSTSDDAPDPTAPDAQVGDARAGTAEMDPTDIAPGVTKEAMDRGAGIAAAATAAGGSEPEAVVGGEATLGATSWGGATEEETDETRSGEA